MIFRTLTDSLQFQGRIQAKSSDKAIQKWLDQSPNPPKPVKVEGTGNSDYVAVADSNLNRYKTKRRG